MNINIPIYIKEIFKKLEENSFEVFVVGGSVRDLLMKKEPKDWDLTTNALPEDVLKIFPEAKYENDFGTVLLAVKYLNLDLKIEDENQVVEITTYRSERGYSDKRRPDEVKFEKNIEKDLERRDFTVNALAFRFKDRNKADYELTDLELIDLFGGMKDINKKIIRAVGEPIDRFKEDALRMMRAIRFACQLGFEIEPKTERGIMKMAGSIKFIAKERIQDELIKILSSNKAYEGIIYLHDLKLLQYIMPELIEGQNVKQNHHHIYTVWQHNLLSLKHCPSKDWRVRLASLLHDVGKPKVKEEKKGVVTFYNHEYVSEKMCRKIMRRLKFSNEDILKTCTLVRNHMFYYDTEEVTASSVRRLIRKVGKENLKDLIDMRIADRLGSGTPKAKPYKLRHLEYMFEKVQNDPVSVKMLKINGDYMIKDLGFEPGPKMGAILDVLLSEVIEDKERNTLEYLEKRAKELNKEDVNELRKKAKEAIAEKRQEDDEEMKKNYWVK